MILDIFQNIAIILFFLGSKITNKIGASGAVLYLIYASLKLLIYFDLITVGVLWFLFLLFFLYIFTLLCIRNIRIFNGKRKGLIMLLAI